MYRSWLAADIASRLWTVESKFPDTLRSRHLGIFKSGFVVGEHCQESVSSITDPKVRFTFNLVCNLIELLLFAVPFVVQTLTYQLHNISEFVACLIL